ncbi:hypothetical protein GCM10011395_34810 [Sphingomonas psychrolutea]|uniref:Uncharacterized protein n=1 Tax=Sphingomonas psychrolutea TaxID=1259676 RepID=A0ABQ1H6Z6_9SPHN|nr:hypothetical protein GCM10011395_34810 [Sphingomonas psychrolutea]
MARASQAIFDASTEWAHPSSTSASAVESILSHLLRTTLMLKAIRCSAPPSELRNSSTPTLTNINVWVSCLLAPAEIEV